jgi:hypothetical protein
VSLNRQTSRATRDVVFICSQGPDVHQSNWNSSLSSRWPLPVFSPMSAALTPSPSDRQHHQVGSDECDGMLTASCERGPAAAAPPASDHRRHGDLLCGKKPSLLIQVLKNLHCCLVGGGRPLSSAFSSDLSVTAVRQHVPRVTGLCMRDQQFSQIGSEIRSSRRSCNTSASFLVDDEVAATSF